MAHVDATLRVPKPPPSNESAGDDTFSSRHIAELPAAGGILARVVHFHPTRPVDGSVAGPINSKTREHSENATRANTEFVELGSLILVCIVENLQSLRWVDLSTLFFIELHHLWVVDMLGVYGTAREKDREKVVGSSVGSSGPLACG